MRSPTLPPATHTNTYLARGAVFDPASPYPEEQARLEEALSRFPIERVVLTHHHVDHVSGAVRLAAHFGVPICASAETARRLTGRVQVGELVREGELVGGLRAIHTPGHALGHLCFFDEDARALIAGDMVASIGTIVIEPDDGGDMADYLRSLDRLRALSAKALLPAHGPPIVGAEAVDAKLAFYIAHRLEREGRVLAALASEPRTIEELVPPAYPDVAPAIYPLAARSLYAHLLKLEHEGRAARDGDRWRRV